MTRKERLAARKELEDYYYNCKLQTPEEVAKLFEVYTRLIWDFHQAGLCYDYYDEVTTSHLEGVGAWVGGHDALEVETLPTFSAFGDSNTNFKQIYAVGDPEHGYHFGQVTSPSRVYAKEGVTEYGCGDGKFYPTDSYYTLCECYVGKVGGRWCITEEWVVSGQEAVRQQLANSRPYCKTILDAYGDTDEKDACKTLEQLAAEMNAAMEKEA